MVEIDAAIEYLRGRVSCDSGDSDESQYMKFGIQLSYVLPFAFLYFSFLIAIVKRRRHCELFEDSFFALHLVDGIVVCAFNDFFIRLCIIIFRQFCSFSLKVPNF